MKKMSFILLVLSLSFADAASRAARLSVCERTPVVRDFLLNALMKTCEAINDTDLSTLKRLAVQNRKVTDIQEGLFSGPSPVELLIIQANPCPGFT